MVVTKDLPAVQGVLVQHPRPPAIAEVGLRSSQVDRAAVVDVNSSHRTST
ncbi:hypothetical protein [Frankia gtarii]|nr:hypothetical protein [Frankia gtarii]